MATLLKTDFTMTEVQPKNGKDFTLEELQGYVGGFIQIIHSDVDDSIMVVNEDGKLCGLPENVNATIAAILKDMIGWSDRIVGDVIVCRSEEVK